MAFSCVCGESMAHSRILYVAPRLVGSIKTWSGLHDKSGQSWLITRAKKGGFDTIWLGPFFRASDIIVKRNGKQTCGNPYAIRDHFTLARQTSATPELIENTRRQSDDLHLQHFTRQAAHTGIQVIGDLVCKYMARDHALVLDEDHAIEVIKNNAQNIQPVYDHKQTLIGIRYDMDDKTNQIMHFKFYRNDDYSVDVSDKNHKKWHDTAQINYSSPTALDFFIKGTDGKQGYWKDVIDWYLDRGFSGFRYNTAYAPPSAIWQELTQHARNRNPDVTFVTAMPHDKNKVTKLNYNR